MKTDQLSQNSYKNISEYVYFTLKNMILSLEFQPLSKLSEVKVAEKLQTSKTPVREAFVKLSDEGLVHILPQRGTIVSPISLSHVEEGRFVRKAVEVQVLKKMMQQKQREIIKVCQSILDSHAKISEDDYQQQFYFDSLFHQEIYKIVEMSNTWDMLSKMNVDYSRMRYLALEILEKNDSIFQEHCLIFDAICKNDMEYLIQTSLNHLDSWNQEKLIIIEKFRGYFI